MIADLAIHAPDKEDGGIPNPHFHVMTIMRPSIQTAHGDRSSAVNMSLTMRATGYWMKPGSRYSTPYLPLTGKPGNAGGMAGNMVSDGQ